MHLQALTQHTEKAVRAGEKKNCGRKKIKNPANNSHSLSSGVIDVL